MMQWQSLSGHASKCLAPGFGGDIGGYGPMLLGIFTENKERLVQAVDERCG